LLALAEPIGVDVQGVEATRLRLPDGGDVPPEWFTLECGVAAQISMDEPVGYQRVVLEVPPGEPLSISDLFDAATEQPIRYGGQIADLVQLAVRIVTSAAGIVPTDLQKLRAATEPPSRGCEEVLGVRDALWRSRGSTLPTGTQEG
jgi:hypothetical protein